MATQLTLGGALQLFGQREDPAGSAGRGAGPRSLLLQLDGTGKLSGNVNLTLDKSIELVPDFSPLTDSLTSASGSFSASLLGGAGGIKFNALAGHGARAEP